MAYQQIHVIIKGKHDKISKFLTKGIAVYTKRLNKRKKILNSKYLKVEGIKSKGNLTVTLSDDVVSIDLSNLVYLSKTFDIYYEITLIDWRNITTKMIVDSGKILYKSNK